MNWYTFLGYILPYTNSYTNYLWIQADRLGGLQTQKSPQGFHLAGSQDFDDGSGNHQPRIWWSWRELNPRPKLLHRRHYMLSQFLHSPVSCEQTRH